MQTPRPNRRPLKPETSVPMAHNSEGTITLLATSSYTYCMTSIRSFLTLLCCTISTIDTKSKAAGGYFVLPLLIPVTDASRFMRKL